MSFFGRGISAFFNQFFRWLFWNKTGQKLLFSILIVFIFFCFIKLGEVSAVEEVQDVNYDVYNYYDSIVNDAILRLEKIRKVSPNAAFFDRIKNSNFDFYFYYGSNDGSSYNNAKPLKNNNLYIFYIDRQYINNLSFTATTNDYNGISGFTIYSLAYPSNASIIYFNNNATSISYVTSVSTMYLVPELLSYKSDNWTTYIQALNNNDMATIKSLLEEIEDHEANIEDALTNTEPSSVTDSFVDVDTSAVDDISSAQVDNVFSSMTTNFANKFTNYDLTTTYSFVWNLNGTNITFYSDTLYKMIRGTFFETLLSMLWYYIFGHYAFVWLSNIIHKIKDGSILDGLEVNEVITKEML